MKKPTKDWFSSAESDLELVKELFDRSDLTHLSAFHIQQAVEKVFKAIIEEYDMGFIKTHSLETLYGIVKVKMNADLDRSMLATLDQSYIDSRYPGQLGLLPEGKPTLLDIAELLKFASDVMELSKNACKLS